jgi:ABC-2 type transport system permease protein
MSALGVLLRKELHATFTSPIAYAVGTVFLLITGYTFSLTLFLRRWPT